MTTIKESTNATLVDRQKTCPFLLRIFLSKGRHFPPHEYTNRRTPSKENELQIYTWLDATLSELMGLIREVPEYRSKGTQFVFSIVFPEPSGPNYRMRYIGLTVGGKRSEHDDLTLGQCRYQIGDFLDVAILPANADASRIAVRTVSQPTKRHRNRHRGRMDRGRMHR